VAAVAPQQALRVGLVLRVAAAGQSGLIPRPAGLPRAMEGPTPSSAVFSGSLSVHLGAYLLLRAGPLLDARPAERRSRITKRSTCHKKKYSSRTSAMRSSRMISPSEVLVMSVILSDV
jgi:hypothetical protein